jgi:hypothetical protein
MTTETLTALRVWTGETTNGTPNWQCIGRRPNRSILKGFTYDAWKASLWKQAAKTKGPITVTWQRSSAGLYINILSVEIPSCPASYCG